MRELAMILVIISGFALGLACGRAWWRHPTPSLERWAEVSSVLDECDKSTKMCSYTNRLSMEKYQECIADNSKLQKEIWQIKYGCKTPNCRGVELH